MKGLYDETRESIIRGSDVFVDGVARKPSRGGLNGFWNKANAKPGPVIHYSFPAGLSIPEGHTGDLIAPSPYAAKKGEPTPA